MTIYSRADVVLVVFPFTDFIGQKKRPALVVSSDDYNRGTPDLIIAQITGNVNAPPRPGDHHIADWQQAGLLAPSLVRAKLATIESSLVDRRLGTMPSADIQGIEVGLREALQL